MGMADALLAVCFVLGLTVLAILFLGARDARRHRRQEEQRPIAERIAEIRKDAALMIQQLGPIFDRNVAAYPEAVAWIPQVLHYYRCLEGLASSPASSPEESRRLAEEAFRYIREHRIKGIFLAAEARKLAELLRRQDAAESVP
jgi:hypothetical protein